MADPNQGNIDTSNFKKCGKHKDQPLQFYHSRTNKFVCALCLFEDQLDIKQLEKSWDICKKLFDDWCRLNEQKEVIKEFVILYSDHNNIMNRVFKLTVPNGG